jgi:hypothetical protein
MRQVVASKISCPIGSNCLFSSAAWVVMPEFLTGLGGVKPACARKRPDAVVSRLSTLINESGGAGDAMRSHGNRLVRQPGGLGRVEGVIKSVGRALLMHCNN